MQTGAEGTGVNEVRSPAVPAARPVFPAEDRERICALVDEVLATGSLTLGRLTAEFERAVAARSNTAFGIAVASGTAALEIVLRAIGVAGRDVVVPANTFYATAGAVVHAGGTPRFADIDPHTLAVTPATVETALSPDTAAVVLVHIGGLVSPATAELREMCDRRGIALIEDAAHAHGAGFDGRPAGSFGAAGTFSFYPTKVITSGEGGVIVTDDEALRDEALIYRDQGKGSFLGGEHVRPGYAWRMSELHAAVGVVQWERLDEFIEVRRHVASMYDEAIEQIPALTAVRPPAGCEPNYYKYVALLAPGIDRGKVKAVLRDEHRVSLSGEVYARPLHHEPVFAGLAHVPLPVAEDVCARQVCLPIHSDMRDAEARQVIDGLAAVLGDLS